MIRTSVDREFGPQRIEIFTSNTSGVDAFSRDAYTILTEGNDTWQSCDPHFVDDSSTQRQYIHYDQNLEYKLNELFRAIKNEFADIDESETLNILLELLNQYGDSFLQLIMSKLITNSDDPMIIAELLIKLGEINQLVNSKNCISWLLQCSLFESDPKIRYGAILGLSYVKTPSILNRLNIALRNEESPILKKDIENLISKIQP